MSTHKCDIKFKELSLYLDGIYKGENKDTLETHISGCACCRERIKEIEALKTSLNGLTPVEESPTFDIEFNRLLEERLKKRQLYRLKIRLEDALLRIRDTFIYPLPAAIRVAASFLIVVGVVFGARAQVTYKLPFIEFSTGDVQIYRPSQKAWVQPRPDMRLLKGDKIKAGKGAVINILSRSRYMARIKDESLIVVAKLDSGLRNIDTDLSVSCGSLLVNTTPKFKGSKMNIYTPSCDAEVIGTAFMVNVSDNRTWLGVLEGKVKLVSKIHPLKDSKGERIATYVASGQKAVTRTYSYPTVPELFSEKEWCTVQELYQLTEAPQIMLLIGTGPDRIDELLRPAPVYIPDIKRGSIPEPIERQLDAIMDTVQAGSGDAIRTATRRLEDALKEYPRSEYSVDILMFIGSHYSFVHNYDDALRIFAKVMEEYPDSAYASLAQCAIATIYQKDLKNIEKAEQTYRELLQAYPDSVDAIRARENLTSLR